MLQPSKSQIFHDVPVPPLFLFLGYPACVFYPWNSFFPFRVFSFCVPLTRSGLGASHHQVGASPLLKVQWLRFLKKWPPYLLGFPPNNLTTCCFSVCTEKAAPILFFPGDFGFSTSCSLIKQWRLKHRTIPANELFFFKTLKHETSLRESGHKEALFTPVEMDSCFESFSRSVICDRRSLKRSFWSIFYAKLSAPPHG